MFYDSLRLMLNSEKMMWLIDSEDIRIWICTIQTGLHAILKV